MWYNGRTEQGVEMKQSQARVSALPFIATCPWATPWVLILYFVK